jgi:CheY-like chemotaxis protein
VTEISDRRPATILVVEDNEDDIFALKLAFRRAGIEIPLQVVTDGQQALDYMSGVGSFGNRNAHPLPELIFLDLKLPFFTGHEILRWIRAQPAFAQLPVIVLSGSDESRDRKEAEANGATGYEVKPISREVLIHSLNAAPALARLLDDRREV